MPAAFFLCLVLFATPGPLSAGLGHDETWHQGSGSYGAPAPKETCLNCDDDHGGGSGDWVAVQTCSGCPGVAAQINGTRSERFPSQAACEKAITTPHQPCTYACCSCRCEEGGASAGSSSSGTKANVGAIRGAAQAAGAAVNAVPSAPQGNGSSLLGSDDSQPMFRQFSGELGPSDDKLGDGKLERLLLHLKKWCDKKAPATAKGPKAAAQAEQLQDLLDEAKKQLDQGEPSFNQRQRARARIDCAEARLQAIRSKATAKRGAAGATSSPTGSVGPRDWAQRRGFSAQEMERIDKAIEKFDFDKADDDPDGITKARATWLEIYGRKGAVLAELKAAATASPGGISSKAALAGQQGRYNDCTIWALANASDTPYGVVAANASEMLNEADWRKKKGIKAAVKESPGLRMDELIVLTEGQGQVATVDRGEFASTIAQGSPVMTSVRHSTAQKLHEGHQIVITKAFKHEGKQWFELADSVDGPIQRRYATAEELEALNLNSGFIYKPENNKTAPLLR